MLAPPILVHLSGPLHPTHNLLNRYGRKQIRTAESGFRRVTLAESEPKRQPLTTPVAAMAMGINS